MKNPLLANIGKGLVMTVFFTQGVAILVPACMNLWITSGAGRGAAYWLSQLPWFAVFLFGNAVVFWLSMHSSNTKTLVDTHGEWFVTGQIAAMCFAGSLVIEWSITNPLIPVDGHQVRWAVALSIPILMNVLAFTHTIADWANRKPWKRFVWVGQDLLAASFYILILVRIGNPISIEPPHLVFLWWWVVIPLAILTTADLIFLRDKKPNSRASRKGSSVANPTPPPGHLPSKSN